jgi:crotonobetainyl-CoA:carnitine CoA-transferase CaiB-like acyl-CoA transferase
MALYRRETTGAGDVIDANMYDALMAWTAHLSGPVFHDRTAPTTRTHRSIGGSAFYNLYETADGRHIALTGRELKFAEALLTALDRRELFELAKADPGPEQQRLIGELRAIFASRSFEEWCDFLAGVDVSWAPVLDMAEAFDHPHAQAREMLFRDDTAMELPGTPIKFELEPGQVRTRAPVLDDFRDEASTVGWDWK